MTVVLNSGQCLKCLKVGLYMKCCDNLKKTTK